jgi:precorrin-6B methylase 2
MDFQLAILIIIFLLGFSFLMMSIAATSLAPWVPSKKRDVLRALRLASPEKGDIIYDLGCGTGTVVFLATALYSVKAIGVEMALPLYLICKIRSVFYTKNIGEIKFMNQNLFKTDISDADIVYVFGMPSALSKKLLPKLEAELKPGAKVVSYVFPIEGWNPKVIDWPKNQNPVYLYVNPVRKDLL